MSRTLVATTLAAGLALVLAGCGGSQKKDDAPPTAACSCGTAAPMKEGAACICADVNAKKSGWCDHCGAGYAEGQKTTCEKCAHANKMCPNDENGRPCEDCLKK